MSATNRIVVLDTTGPQGRRVLVPEIADYEAGR